MKRLQESRNQRVAGKAKAIFRHKMLTSPDGQNRQFTNAPQWVTKINVWSKLKKTKWDRNKDIIKCELKSWLQIQLVNDYLHQQSSIENPFHALCNHTLHPKKFSAWPNPARNTQTQAEWQTVLSKLSTKVQQTKTKAICQAETSAGQKRRPRQEKLHERLSSDNADKGNPHVQKCRALSIQGRNSETISHNHHTEPIARHFLETK